MASIERPLVSLLIALCCIGRALAQGQPNAAAGGDAENVAKQLANPIANLVSIPLQLNWEQGVGPNDDLRTVMNFQPVVPFSLNEDWNLIGRMILPYVSQPSLGPGAPSTSGVGDMLFSLFLSPVKSDIAIWGVGPVIALPMNTDPSLGSGKWSAGPTGVVLKQSGQWTYGALVNHLWSFANTGDIERNDVNQSYMQPFVAYTTKSAVTFNVSSESTANWEAPSGEKWTVPINFNVSKVTKLGPFPFSLGGGFGVFVEKPEGAPEWKVRFTATLILPRAR